MAQLTRALAPATAAALAAALCAAGAARAACLRYEPATVVLSGRLASHRDGKRMMLRLDKPICVVAGSGHAAAERVRLVRMDLAPPPAVGGGLPWFGRRAVVAGSLYRGAHDREGELSLLVTGFGRAR